jgi:hypothetical protein
VIPGGVFRKGRPPSTNATSNAAVRVDGASSLLITSVRGVDHVLLSIADLQQLAKFLPAGSDDVPLLSRVWSLLRTFSDVSAAPSVEPTPSASPASVEPASPGNGSHGGGTAVEQRETVDSETIETAVTSQPQLTESIVVDTPRVRRGGVFHPYSESPKYQDGRLLRPYQVEGLNWLLSRWHAYTNAILADEMGLGKTAQTLSFLDHLHRVHAIRGPFLVVVPLSTIQHWEREIHAWTTLPVCVYRDSSACRAVIREWEWFYPGVKKSVAKFAVRPWRCVKFPR